MLHFDKKENAANLWAKVTTALYVVSSSLSASAATGGEHSGNAAVASVMSDSQVFPFCYTEFICPF